VKRITFQTFQIAALLLTIAAYCRPAHAYVDMGTGSYIIQVGIAAVAGALFSAKIFWAGLRDRLRGSRPGGASVATPASAERGE
jgi:hypothetical protein